MKTSAGGDNEIPDGLACETRFGALDFAGHASAAYKPKYTADLFGKRIQWESHPKYYAMHDYSGTDHMTISYRCREDGPEKALKKIIVKCFI